MAGLKVNIQYFASVREVMGVGSETLLTASTTVAQLRDELIARNERGAEALQRGRALRVALNQVLSVESAALSDGCEVAFFPPVTGG